MKCKKCGAELRDGALFCRECGAKVEPDKPKIRFCRECGSKLEDGAKFCTECGTKINIDFTRDISARPKEREPESVNKVEQIEESDENEFFAPQEDTEALIEDIEDETEEWDEADQLVTDEEKSKTTKQNTPFENIVALLMIFAIISFIVGIFSTNSTVIVFSIVQFLVACLALNAVANANQRYGNARGWIFLTITILSCAFNMVSCMSGAV